MSKENVTAEEFSLDDLANAHLLIQKHNSITVSDLVDLLIDEAVDDAAQGEEEDAGSYALLAAQLITAFKLFGQPEVRS